MPVPVVLGMLHAVAVPPPSPFGNGETEFADMRAAYDALPETTQAAIDGLVVEHDIFWSRGAGRVHRFPAGREGEIPALAAAPGPHPSGIGTQDTVSVGAWLACRRLAGGGGAVLLLDLTAHATQQRFVYRHRWHVGDLVIWDNRCTMHRGRPHDETKPATCGVRQRWIRARRSARQRSRSGTEAPDPFD